MDFVYARLPGILNLKRAARRVAAVEHREDDRVKERGERRVEGAVYEDVYVVVRGRRLARCPRSNVSDA